MLSDAPDAMSVVNGLRPRNGPMFRAGRGFNGPGRTQELRGEPLVRSHRIRLLRSGASERALRGNIPEGPAIGVGCGCPDDFLTW
ncbi:hypothetical protein GCM10010211_15130 [Streptomyces albospinus]|uniref:Uncharacterized protein n=1 Tax=Streptomyces albospinus TaxID=285515 RepID=A0ABQ2UWF3_9ACTN|nr:hypothetical protein GCM10010211_15130 [Streptomyces albospinus]